MCIQVICKRRNVQAASCVRDMGRLRKTQGRRLKGTKRYAARVNPLMSDYTQSIPCGTLALPARLAPHIDKACTGL